MLNYAARNAILPNLTGFAMSLGFVVGGAILIEYVFNYPGVVCSKHAVRKSRRMSTRPNPF